jgi:hypothetical protein
MQPEINYDKSVEFFLNQFEKNPNVQQPGFTLRLENGKLSAWPLRRGEEINKNDFQVILQKLANIQPQAASHPDLHERTVDFLRKMAPKAARVAQQVLDPLLDEELPPGNFLLYRAKELISKRPIMLIRVSDGTTRVAQLHMTVNGRNDETYLRCKEYRKEGTAVESDILASRILTVTILANMEKEAAVLPPHIQQKIALNEIITYAKVPVGEKDLNEGCYLSSFEGCLAWIQSEDVNEESLHQMVAGPRRRTFEDAICETIFENGLISPRVAELLATLRGKGLLEKLKRENQQKLVQCLKYTWAYRQKYEKAETCSIDKIQLILNGLPYSQILDKELNFREFIATGPMISPKPLIFIRLTNGQTHVAQLEQGNAKEIQFYRFSGGQKQLLTVQARKVDKITILSNLNAGIQDQLPDDSLLKIVLNEMVTYAKAPPLEEDPNKGNYCCSFDTICNILSGKDRYPKIMNEALLCRVMPSGLTFEEEIFQAMDEKKPISACMGNLLDILRANNLIGELRPENQQKLIRCLLNTAFYRVKNMGSKTYGSTQIYQLLSELPQSVRAQTLGWKMNGQTLKEAICNALYEDPLISPRLGKLISTLIHYGLHLQLGLEDYDKLPACLLNTACHIVANQGLEDLCDLFTVLLLLEQQSPEKLDASLEQVMNGKTFEDALFQVMTQEQFISPRMGELLEVLARKNLLWRLSVKNQKTLQEWLVQTVHDKIVKGEASATCELATVRNVLNQSVNKQYDDHQELYFQSFMLREIFAASQQGSDTEKAQLLEKLLKPRINALIPFEALDQVFETVWGSWLQVVGTLKDVNLKKTLFEKFVETHCLPAGNFRRLRGYKKLYFNQLFRFVNIPGMCDLILPYITKQNCNIRDDVGQTPLSWFFKFMHVPEEPNKESYLNAYIRPLLRRFLECEVKQSDAEKQKMQAFLKE